MRGRRSAIAPGRLFGVRAHGAEFIDIKWLFMQAYAFLAIKYRPGRVILDR